MTLASFVFSKLLYEQYLVYNIQNIVKIYVQKGWKQVCCNINDSNGTHMSCMYNEYLLW